MRKSISPVLGPLTWAYTLGLILFLGTLEWYGERNWILSGCLYLPIQVWLLPLVVLFPLSVISRPRFCVVHCFSIFLVLGIFGGYRLHFRPVAETQHSLTVVTNNIGQSNRQSMQPFILSENPDLIALQDALGRGPAYSREYPESFVVARGEFVLVSKYPVLTADLVKEALWKNSPVAARFELSFKGAPLVIYNVHMPTPRSDLLKLRGAGAMLPGRRKSDGRSLAESMSARIELARSLVAVFQRETQPFIVVGDFNMPDHGYVYHLIASSLEDAFDKVGTGYGYSFPGVTRNPLTLFGPWLRLDYLFAGRGWEPTYSRVEPHRRSQHRAVVARFEPRSSPKS